MAADTSAKHSLSRLIEPNPHKPGLGEWRIAGSRLAVWQVINQIALELGLRAPSDIAAVLITTKPDSLVSETENFYGLPPEAIEAALAFARSHIEEVAAQLILSRDEVGA